MKYNISKCAFQTTITHSNANIFILLSFDTYQWNNVELNRKVDSMIIEKINIIKVIFKYNNLNQYLNSYFSIFHNGKLSCTAVESLIFKYYFDVNNFGNLYSIVCVYNWTLSDIKIVLYVND